MENKKRKLKLKTWCICLLYFITTFILSILLYKYNIIYINNNKHIDITRLFIIFTAYEITRATIKELYKRIKEQTKED